MGDGSQVRDYLYIDDFVDSVIRLVELPDTSGVYNVGSGVGTTLRDLIQLVEAATGREIQVRYDLPRSDDVAKIVLEIENIRRATGWTPSTSLSEGIARTWQWLREDT